MYLMILNALTESERRALRIYGDLGMIESTGTRLASLPSSRALATAENVHSHQRQVATAGHRQTEI